MFKIGDRSNVKDEDMLFFSVEGVTKKDVVKAGSMKVTVNDEDVALFVRNGKFYAIQEKCPHQGGPLHLAEIEELPDKSLCIKCPWHSWKFCLTDGKCIVPYKPEKTALIYPVRVSNEKISIGFTKISPKVFCTPPD